MHRSLLTAIVLTVAATRPAMRGQDANLERGTYLVEEVGGCQECHTPRTETGPPMPACMLKPDNADAIGAYLKSLP